jgi:hypothetical protein
MVVIYDTSGQTSSGPRELHYLLFTNLIHLTPSAWPWPSFLRYFSATCHRGSASSVFVTPAGFLEISLELLMVGPFILVQLIKSTRTKRRRSPKGITHNHCGRSTSYSHSPGIQ